LHIFNYPFDLRPTALYRVDGPELLVDLSSAQPLEEIFEACRHRSRLRCLDSDVLHHRHFLRDHLDDSRLFARIDVDPTIRRSPSPGRCRRLRAHVEAYTILAASGVPERALVIARCAVRVNVSDLVEFLFELKMR
jgi:hypothetical protein